MVHKTATPEQKAKAAVYQQQWRVRNYERWREIATASGKKWRAANGERDLECQRAHRYKVRQEILTILGGLRCTHCGYDKDWRALQIDHVNGGGKHDRDTMRGTTNMWAFRRKLMKPEFLEAAKMKYQVLCANCNRIKVYTNNEQPTGFGLRNNRG